MAEHIHNEDCCSEIKVVLDRTEKQQKELANLWCAIDEIRNRLPNWATFVFSMMTFFLGVACTLLFKGG